MAIPLKNLPGDGKKHWDDKNKCLCLRDGKRSKTWYYGTRIERVFKWHKLGEYPDMTLSEARLAAVKIAANRRACKTEYMPVTLSDVFSKFHKEKEGVKRSLRNDEINMRITLAPLAEKELSLITKDDVLAIRKAKEDAPVAFNRSLALLCNLYNYASRRMGISLPNIAEQVQKYPERPRHKFVPIEKSDLFFSLLQKFPRDFSDIVQLYLYLGQRSGNIKAMRTIDIDMRLQVWNIAKEDIKTGRETVVQLSPEACSIIQRRINDGLTNTWVFPAAFGRNGKKGHAHRRHPQTVETFQGRVGRTITIAARSPKNARHMDVKRWRINRRSQ